MSSPRASFSRLSLFEVISWPDTELSLDDVSWDTRCASPRPFASAWETVCNDGDYDTGSDECSSDEEDVTATPAAVKKHRASALARWQARQPYIASRRVVHLPVRYQSRSNYARIRPRVHGRFQARLFAPPESVLCP